VCFALWSNPPGDVLALVARVRNGVSNLAARIIGCRQILGQIQRLRTEAAGRHLIVGERLAGVTDP